MKSSIPVEPGEVYQTPSLRLLGINLENAVCGSPVPGGNEDIGYEDWQ
jgi:hypothetical protein